MEDAFLAAFIQHSSFIIQHSFGKSDGAHDGGRGFVQGTALTGCVRLPLRTSLIRGR
jgi:hypothetical protein